ncbi:MAG: hypothetical protein Ct9H90mP18_05820 [Gammaproteobacteria bacterium]|nr:MAG: hypothetical protein Ct9H90mP18_05820 [Gammaproteobacteria bacterium]
MIVKLSVDAIAIVAIIEPQYDSKISDPIPATSPTLSPTLSQSLLDCEDHPQVFLLHFTN